MTLSLAGGHKRISAGLIFFFFFFLAHVQHETWYGVEEIFTEHADIAIEWNFTKEEK